MSLALILDFDGTCTLRDVGYSICARFVGEAACAPAIESWLRGEIALHQAQAQIWPLVRAPEAEVMALVAEVGALRPGLDRLLDLGLARGWKLQIASGGFDFYIRSLLGARYAELDILCNRAWFTPAGMAVDFPHSELVCPRCAICKGLLVDNLKRAGYTTIFVGDGLSDCCAAGRADRLFTIRGAQLERYCRERGIAHEVIDSLDEVAERLS